ncbi:hypothetical protein HAX54_017068 [Datura stramonium]|uniref:Uncharacterized protein n=1 Tax=Datura stramonium TaxID=4076 RepID=A0ABS8UJY7_DATST|nr:hypothetical protein [Datura stramonium]
MVPLGLQERKNKEHIPATLALLYLSPFCFELPANLALSSLQSQGSFSSSVAEFGSSENLLLHCCTGGCVVLVFDGENEGEQEKDEEHLLNNLKQPWISPYAEAQEDAKSDWDVTKKEDNNLHALVDTEV